MAMRFDRYLLPLAIFFLCFQLLWLAAELQFIQISFLQLSKTENGAPVVGKIVEVQNSARRRPLSEIVWNEGQVTEEVNAYDALLTLKNSSMKVQLTNGAELNLSENTLVFLEPISEDSGDQRIRIRFVHGSLRSKVDLKLADFKSDSWVISPEKGSEFQLKTLQDGKVELEILKGKAVATHGTQTFNIDNGEVAELNQGTITDRRKISLLISWPYEKNHHRLYSHHWPAPVPLRWQGQAEHLIISRSGSIEKDLPLSPGQQEALLHLTEGTYEIRLENKQEVSSWLRYEIWQAPVIHLMRPLPRDRYQLGENLKYIWLKPPEVNLSLWQFSSSTNFKDGTANEKVPLTHLESHLKQAGHFNWRVLGYDKDGFEIPPPYSSPLYVVPQPLSAPVLLQPEVRRPASRKKEKRKAERKKSPHSMLLKKWRIISDFLIGEAHGYSGDDDDFKIIQHPLKPETENPPIEIESFRFAWQPVIGAQHYIIEISETPDFRKPLVEKKILKNEFVWTNIHLKLEKFYWRVAAGTKIQMGRFSPVAEIKVADLVSGSSVKGVVLVKSEKITKLPGKKEKPLEPEKPIIQEKPENFLEPFMGKKLIAGFVYESSLYADSANVPYRFSGVSMKFRFYKDSQSEKYRLGGMAQLQLIPWINTDSDSIMQGQKYLEIRGKALGWFGSRSGFWTGSLGLEAATLPLRNGLESVALTSYGLANLGVWYDWGRDWNMKGKSGLMVSAGSEITEVSLSIFGYKPFKIGEWQSYWGPEFEFSSIQQNNGIKGTGFQIGISLGVSW
jgi:hypothetical protein